MIADVLTCEEADGGRDWLTPAIKPLVANEEEACVNKPCVGLGDLPFVCSSGSVGSQLVSLQTFLCATVFERWHALLQYLTLLHFVHVCSKGFRSSCSRVLQLGLSH